MCALAHSIFCLVRASTISFLINLSSALCMLYNIRENIDRATIKACTIAAKPADRHFILSTPSKEKRYVFYL